MKELLDALDRWEQAGKRAALARVVNIDGSGPREPGAAMAVNEDGEVAGSVSGGCVEGAVVEEGMAVLEGRKGAHLATFGYSDDEAFAAGLTCGGTIRLFIEPFDWKHGEGAAGQFMGAFYEKFRDAIRSETPVAIATVVEGDRPGARLMVFSEGATDGDGGDLGNADLNRVVARDARGELEAGRTVMRHCGPNGEARQSESSIFIESFAPPPRMIVFGAVDFTASLARVANVMGYHVTVCDARAVFATRKRFPMAHEVVVAWPQHYLETMERELTARDAICVLTHDHKFDVPAIIAALKTRAGYIGCMGSRRTHRDRSARLLESGVSEEELARVMSPIGLDIGARTPAETAISICAEIIANSAGKSVPSLRDTAGPIHPVG